MSRNMHRFEELTPCEFDREKERASIIYAAAGPVEYHEECNALGIDPFKGYQLCLDAAEITGGIVFPMIPVAPAGHRPFLTGDELRELRAKPHFTGYTSVPGLYPGVFNGREVCRALYRELLETFAQELQFRMCVFFGAHAPAGWLIKDIVAESGGGGGDDRVVGEFCGMKVMAVGSLDYNADLVNQYNEEHGIPRVNHGGLWEAAINYAINPDYFQPERLDEADCPQHYGPLAEEHFDGCRRPTRSEYRHFSPEFAHRLYRTTLDRFAADVLKNYGELNPSPRNASPRKI